MPIHPAATVHPSSRLGDDVVIWAGTQVRENAEIGARTSIGQYAYIGPGVRIGADCKIQNAALVYEPAVVGAGVFIGPQVVFTNDRHPRAITPAGVATTAADWDAVGVTVEDGASIGAAAVCVAPITIGEWATVAAGAVVLHDVPAHALVGGVPARQLGWVGRSGRPLREDGGAWRCDDTGDVYTLIDGRMTLTV
jgi:UDP-2-acetamido-3-amino-2,3-dideoxy-glucuronate N-acetyltransferase